MVMLGISQPLLTRGEVAKQGGVNRETIRYYERSGLLREKERTSSGYMLFDQSAVDRVRFIKRAQNGGFSLHEIKMLLEIRFNEDGTCGDVQTIAAQKIAEIDEKIRALQAMKFALQDVIDVCPGGERPVSDCPILERFTVHGDTDNMSKWNASDGNSNA